MFLWFFFLVVFLLLSRAKRKEEGEWLQNTFKMKEKRSCWSGEINVLRNYLLCFEIEMSSVATVAPVLRKGPAWGVGEEERLLQRKQTSVHNWNICSFQIVLWEHAAWNHFFPFKCFFWSSILLFFLISKMFIIHSFLFIFIFWIMNPIV